MNEKLKSPFIDRLWSLVEQDQRGALADLRLGLGQAPGTVPKMYPYVVPYLPNECSRSTEDSYYLVASLFAYYQSGNAGNARKRIDQGNIGDHLRSAIFYNQLDELPVERRFNALLAADPMDLPQYLKQIVSLLKSHDVPIHWEQLFRDLQWWQHESKFVQKQWANSYWHNQNQPSEQEKGENHVN